jgi:hypothetical protein
VNTFLFGFLKRKESYKCDHVIYHQTVNTPWYIELGFTVNASQKHYLSQLTDYNIPSNKIEIKQLIQIISFTQLAYSVYTKMINLI